MKKFLSVLVASIFILNAFSYSRTESGWERTHWEKEIWGNPDWKERFAETSLELAGALRTPYGEPMERGWIAAPLDGRIWAKFGPYMIASFATGMPEMFLDLEKTTFELHE
ncbi:MAG TPA: hypothetical protein VK041_07510 [Opitutales bacterium]|nr:hypothetical protein [Opitutales bacterium]